MKTVSMTATVMALWLLGGATVSAAASPAEQLRGEYRQQGAGPFSAEGGKALWLGSHQGRSCSDCHTADPANRGEHVKTGKAIEPLAPSVNPERLSEAKTIRKWLRRNCQWTFDRLCSPQEKGDFLTWLEQQ